MNTCTKCQASLLDHLYGLLDAAEAAAVEQHLAKCPTCAAAKEAASRAQGLFAKAAKSEFPQVHFTPPLSEPSDATPFVPPKPAARKIEWVRWVVAASVLALIPGTLIPISKLSDRYQAASRSQEESAEKLASARIEVLRAEQDREAADALAAAKSKQTRIVGEWLEAEKTERNRKLSVNVQRPVSANPGAPSEYVISIADSDNALAGRRVEARFQDQTGAVLFTQAIEPKREQSVRLPVEVWSRLTPTSELFLNVAAIDAAGALAAIHEPIRLFGPVYTTMLVTDKATYRPGDRLFFRSLTLDRITLRPPAREQRLRYALRKADGSGKAMTVEGSTRLTKMDRGRIELVADAAGNPVRGVGCGEFILPANLADGEYALTLMELPGPNGAAPAMAYPATRSIRVRSGGPERFTKKITFAAGSFAVPGEPIVAVAELLLGGKPVVGAKGRVVVEAEGLNGPAAVLVAPQAKRADGANIPFTGITDQSGRFKITVASTSMKARDVKLMVEFTHDGATEAIAERVPIAGKETIIEFFPEGGKLIAGVPNRVYVRGTTSSGKPIRLNGLIYSGTKVLTRVDSADGPKAARGLGAFTFTPEIKKSYELRLSGANPAMAGKRFPLPPAEPEGVVLTALDTVVKPGRPITIRLYSVGKDRDLVVGVYTRGRLADTKTVHVKAGEPEVATLLARADFRGGVTRITVFEQPKDPAGDLRPVAERLVFRQPGKRLNLAVSPGAKGAFAPGSQVDLSIAATDENGHPAAAILWAAAVNSAVAPGAKDRSLPTHFLLAGEIQTPDDLEYADFLLSDRPQAAEALDLVLATQGWRRFAEQSVQPPLAGSRNERLFKMSGRTPAPKGQASRSIAERFWPRFNDSTIELDTAAKRKKAADAALQNVFDQYEARRRDTAKMVAAVRSVAEPLNAMRDRLAFAAGVVSLLSLMLGALALVRGQGGFGAAPYFIASLASCGLACYLTIDANEHPAFVVDQASEELARPTPAPETVRAQGKGAAPHLPPVAPQMEWSSPERREPLQIFGMNVPMMARSMPKSVRPGFKATIPDDLLHRAPALLDQRPPVSDAVLKALRAANEASVEEASRFADARAVGLLGKLEAELNGRKTPAADRIRASLPRTAPLVVREYAAPRPGSAKSGLDFPDADTILWKPVIVLPTDGKTTIPFHLGAAPGGYQIVVAGHSADGRIGSVRTSLPVAPAR